MNYCTKNDVIALFRPLSAEEGERVDALIPLITNRLRAEANLVGKDLDKMLSENPSLVFVAKQVAVDVIARTLMSPTENQFGAMSQMSESALGYTVSGTFMNPGGGVFIKKEELRMLGLRKQSIGSIDMLC